LDLEVLLLSHRSSPDAGKPEDINRNWLREFPHCIASLSSLEHLEASNVGLSSLPDTLGQLAHLRHLDLSYNMIGWLANSFTSLKCLEYLDLSNNCLLMLPLGR
jgi:Leucine-rich repeat (LRR) protein